MQRQRLLVAFLLFTQKLTFASDTWAVLVCTSRSWFNYRHIANTLSVYRTVKRLGIPDSQIILMLADDIACNPRNSFPSHVFHSIDHADDIYSDNIEVDYVGPDVTVANLIRLLTGNHLPKTPQPKRLSTRNDSNILIYLTGHGGNEFLKFQDNEELQTQDLVNAITQMHVKERYGAIFAMVDTCQASTLYSKVQCPNILAMSSSIRGEDSYSHLTDPQVGVALVDRFTYFSLKYLNGVEEGSNATLDSLFSSLDGSLLLSTPHFSHETFPIPPSKVPVSQFFSSDIPNPRQILDMYPVFEGQV